MVSLGQMSRDAVLLGCCATILVCCGACGNRSDSPTAPVDTSVVDSGGVAADAARDATNDTLGKDVSDADAAAVITWTAVPSGDGCGLFYADNPTALPIRTWSACGSGCTWASAAPPGEIAATLGGSTGGLDGGSLLLRLRMGNGSRALMAISRVDDGIVLGAVEQRANFDTCGVIGYATEAPRLLAFIRTGSGIFAGVLGPDAHWNWQASWLTPPSVLVTTQFALGSAYGLGFYDGSISAVMSLAAPSWNVLDKYGSPGAHAIGGGDSVAVWTTGDTVRRWSAVDGMRILASPASTTIASSARATSRVAWIGGHGPRATDGQYDAAELYWMSEPDSAVHTGPSLPASACLDDLQVDGDFAAVVGCAPSPSTTTTFFVMQFSTGRVWAIPPRAGMRYRRLLAFSSSEAVLAEDVVSHAQDAFPTLVRFDMSELDALGATP